MIRQKNEEEIAVFLSCSSILEEKVFHLYRDLADKIQHPLVKSLLIYVAYDSLKHSTILRKMYGDFLKSEGTIKDCEKNFGDLWKMMRMFSEEMLKKEKIETEEIPLLATKLSWFEGSLSEIYYALIQLKTLQFIAQKIHKIYNIDLDNLKSVFELIIIDEQSHKEIMSTITDFLTEEKQDTVKNNTPIVRYQNPNQWYRPKSVL